MDKIKFFNQQLNGQIVMSELEAEHLADSIRLLSAGEDPTTWAEEVPFTLPRWPVTASLTAAAEGGARFGNFDGMREERA